mmetsp:Transcript_31094/g.47179  ORF Transcript_31094/g.47179 Transcript_31094/m.47179 type:complete len:234 (-) Transcript_31094:1480-2181(-)
MKLAILSLVAGSAAAFAPSSVKTSSTSLNAAAEDLVGALPPVGFFDPLGFADKADENTLKRYREAELTHGRVSMLAVLGFLVGEKVEGSSFLFDASIKGPAISHLGQVPEGFWAILLITIGAAEQFRAEKGWVDPSEVPVDQPGLLKSDYVPGDLGLDPSEVPVDQPGLLKSDYVPGDLGFDPLGLKPEDPEEFMIMQTKELQNGRLAMLAAAGFLAQELADGKGIVEHFQSM